MFSRATGERLDALIDELIMDGGVEAVSVASILLAAKDAVERDHHVMLSRVIWTALNELTLEHQREENSLEKTCAASSARQ
jgi:hypothetical protein